MSHRGMAFKARRLAPLRCLKLMGAIVVGAGIVLSAGCVPVVEAGVGSWTSGGPEGGDINAVVIDPKTADVVYASTFSRGVFKSATGGHFWTRIDFGAAAPSSDVTNALAIDPKTPATLDAGLGHAG